MHLGERGARGPRVVALGGGHGLAATIGALTHLSHNVTAVVTVADDGGSSGRLREEFGTLPPGDLRMALAALCDTGEWGLTWRDVMQHRFQSQGPIAGHALGNIIILSLWDILGDEVSGLDLAGRLLGARGRVLPMSSKPLLIEADVELIDGNMATIYGQVNCAKTKEKIKKVRITPADAPVLPEVKNALAQAEYIIFGPGSWYTSVIPHLLVPEIYKAVLASQAKKILCLNLAPQADETSNMQAADLVQVIHSYAPELLIDMVLADPASVDNIFSLEQAAQSMGAQVLLRQVGVVSGQPVHDPLRLAAALRDIFENVIGDVSQV